MLELNELGFVMKIPGLMSSFGKNIKVTATRYVVYIYSLCKNSKGSWRPHLACDRVEQGSLDPRPTHS